METGKKAKAFNIRHFLHNFGKLVLDVTKLCFGSLVLGSVIKGEIPTQILLTVELLLRLLVQSAEFF